MQAGGQEFESLHLHSDESLDVRNHVKLGTQPRNEEKLLGRKQAPCAGLPKQKHICLGMRAFHTNPFSFIMRLIVP